MPFSFSMLLYEVFFSVAELSLSPELSILLLPEALLRYFSMNPSFRELVPSLLFVSLELS